MWVTFYSNGHFAGCFYRYNITLSSDTPPLTAVASMVAFDADAGGNGIIRYSLLNETLVPFTVDPVTADLETTGTLSSQSGYVFSIVAMDTGMPSLSSTTVVSVSLESSGSFPVFHHNYYNITECENIPPNKPVLTVNASGSPSYRLVNGRGYSSNGENTFLISGAILRASERAIVNFELLGPRKSFVFLVEAFNSVGTNFAVVEIFLTDIDDNLPVVDSSPSFTPPREPAGRADRDPGACPRRRLRDQRCHHVQPCHPLPFFQHLARRSHQLHPHV